MIEAFKVHKKKLLIAGAALAGIALAVGGFFAWQYFSDPARASRDTAVRVTEQVRKIYEFPADDEPSVARLEEPEKLPKDDFYKNAQKGDYVLVFRNEKLALIYRESTKKLINVDHVEFGQKP